MKSLFYFLTCPFILPPPRLATTATDADSLDIEARANFERAAGREPDPHFGGYYPKGLNDFATRPASPPLPALSQPSLPPRDWYDPNQEQAFY